jgi:uncharacterized protein HemY
MIEQTLPSPFMSERKLNSVELRIANLRRELEADAEPSSQAAILYQIGALYEHELKQVSVAVDYYGQAHAIAPSFQPAVIAHLRIAERSKNGDALASLRSNNAASARSPALSAAALVDLAVHSEDWALLLREAIARSPEPVVPALILEWLAGARGDEGARRHALRIQAEHATHPGLRSALWIDLALSEIDAGHATAAIDALDCACEGDALAWQARSLQLRIAREHGRWDVFTRATTSMARLLETAVEAGETQDPLDLSVPEQERLPMAALLWRQAAACGANQLEDADAAAEYLDSALRVFPDHRVTRLQALLIQERRGDRAAMQEASDWFRAVAPEDPAFVAHEVRQALSSEDLRQAVETLRDAAERYPNSDYARAALDVALIRSAAHGERSQRLLERAPTADGEARAQVYWHGAQLTAASSAPSDQTQSLYTDAAGANTHLKEWILREAFGAALRAKRPEIVLQRCDELMQCGLNRTERATLAFLRYDVMQHVQGANQEALLLLRDSVEEPDAQAWAPHLARARAAWERDDEMLARAHEVIAGLTTGDGRLGHLCAAGQAYARNRSWEAAERVLRQALRAAPDDGYVVTLLDGVLREGGQPEEVVSLARERGRGESSAGLGELSLLLAGATAERSGNLTAARLAYEQALLQAPRSPSAALALLDIARRQDDAHAVMRAYGHLSDGALGGGIPELCALLQGDALSRDQGTGSAACAAYERALEHPATSLASAIALLSMPTRYVSAEQYAAADEALADADAAGHEHAGGFADAYGALLASLDDASSCAGDAWLQLAALAPTKRLRAEVLLQGLRATRIAGGTDAADEIFLLAQEAEDLAESNADAATAIDEALAPGDDGDFRAKALERRLHHSKGVGRGALDAALCRALVEAGRGDEAVALLSDAVNERPDDLALWETLRNAARQARQWSLVAQACERLAQFVQGPLKADLLEEAGVVRLDCLGQHQQAEDLFRCALEEDARRDVAFRRLHDLLAAQEDAEGLNALVSNRLALGVPKDRLDLLYERARLLRGFSDRPGALEALEELFTAEPDHAGALALAAEVYVSLEQWAQAVECLQRLSKANIPDEQRRVAHLGAADFLETRLMAKREALGELRALEALGLADAQIWIRIGALEDAFDNRRSAADAYARALEVDPTNAVAISSLVELVDEPAKSTALRNHERAIWERIDGSELDAGLLEGLRNSAQWLGQADRADAVRAVQTALGLGGSAGGGSVENLRRVSMDAVWNQESDVVLRKVVLQAGPALSKDRLRGRKAAPGDPLCAEIERMCQRFGARVGTIELSDELATIVARIGRDGAIDWVAPREAYAGLDGAGRFVAGRLAWAAPHGAARFLDGSPQIVAGTLAAILRAARCKVAAGEPALPAADVKLRRAVRRAVQEAVGDSTFDPASLLAFARSLQRSADRAGLLASGDIAAALATLLNGRVTLHTLRNSSRVLDLLRFWLADNSPLWGRDG